LDRELEQGSGVLISEEVAMYNAGASLERARTPQRKRR
jgi:hypothetical protein